MARYGSVLSNVAITDKSVLFVDSNTIAEDNSNFQYDTSLPQLAVGPLNPLYNFPEIAMSIGGDFGGPGSPDYISYTIQNTSSYGSSDYIVANDLDDGTILNGYYGDFGMAGSTYASNPGTDINQPNDVYLFSSVNAGNLNISTQGVGKKIRFATAGDTVDQVRIDIEDDRTTIYANKDTELIPAPLIGADWTATGGWAVTAGELVLSSNAGPNTIEPDPVLSIAPGVTYRVIIEASATSGIISYTLGGVPGTMIVSGITTDFITATGTGNFIITGAASATATITSVSVRALIADTGNLVVEGGVILGSGIETTSGASVATIDGDGVTTFSEIPYVPAILPTQDYQVANKLYVDTFAQGFVPIPFCDLATTGSNIALTGEQTIDGVLTSGSRILVKDQTAQEDNGIYISGGGAWTRATDYNTTAEIRIGQVTYIAQGTINNGYRYVQYLFNPATDTLGVDPIAFTVLSVIPIFTASDGVQLVGSNFQADYDNITIGTTAGHLQVKNNSITYAKMQAVSATSKLLGSSSTTTPVQEITIGSGLTLTGTTLTATGTYADVNLSNLASPTAINQHLLPAVNDTYTLGNSTFKWRQLRLSNGTGTSIIADGHITTSTPAVGGAFGFFAGSGAAGGGTGGAINAGNGGTGGGAGGSIRAGDGATSFPGGDLIAGSSNGFTGTSHGGDVWAGDGGGTSGRGGHVYSGNSFGASDQGGDYIAGFGSSRSGSFITDSTGFFKGGAVLLVDGSSNAIQFNSPASIVTPYTMIMPNAPGTGALTNDGLGNMSWVTLGAGDVVGPASTTDNAIARFDLTTGKLIQNSGITISDLTANLISISTPTVAGQGTAISILAGNSSTTIGGNLTVKAGTSIGANTGGGSFVRGGTAGATGIGGEATVIGADGGVTSGAGGFASLRGGSGIGTNASGGDVFIYGGNKTGSGTYGKIKLAQFGGAYAILDLSLVTTTDKTITFPNSTGTLVLSNNITSTANGIGYATGAGGAVIQPTNKNTGVTLNKICGQITMNNGALNAGAEASFTFTNSTIAANDVVMVTIASGGTVGSYMVSVGATAAGSCSITLTNLSTSNLSQAVVLNFAVIKSVNA